MPRRWNWFLFFFEKRMKLLEGSLFPDFITLLKSWGSVIRSSWVNRNRPLTLHFKNFELKRLTSFFPSFSFASRHYDRPECSSFQKNRGSFFASDCLADRSFSRNSSLLLDSLIFEILKLLKLIIFLLHCQALSKFYWQKRGLYINFFK